MQIKVATLGEGHFFGASDIFHKRKNMFTVKATEDSEVYSVPRSEF